MARGHLRLGGEDQAAAEVEHVTDALAALGLVMEDELAIDQDECWLWPENKEGFCFWLAIQTQWNASMGGATGLNYPGVEACMRLQGVKKKGRQRLFAQVQLMESACLEEWARKRKA